MTPTRLISLASILTLLIVGFVAFGSIESGNGDGIVERASKSAALSVAGSVVDLATGASHVAAQFSQAADVASDVCAKACASDKSKSAMHRVASSGEACSFGEAASWMAKSCTPSDDGAPAVIAAGNMTGQFMNELTSSCQSACGVSTADIADVVAQPGAEPGEVAQCPVSGAVFTVREDNPGLGIDGTPYYTCCGTCAGILAKNPERFLEVESG